MLFSYLLLKFDIGMFVLRSSISMQVSKNIWNDKRGGPIKHFWKKYSNINKVGGLLFGTQDCISYIQK